MRFLIALILFWGTGAYAEPRPALSGVKEIRIANYNSPSVLVDGKDIGAIVRELNELRRKDWRRADARVSCYSTVVLTAGKKRLGEFRVRADAVVERPVDKGQTVYSIETGPADLRRLIELLGQIQPAKDCN